MDKSKPATLTCEVFDSNVPGSQAFVSVTIDGMDDELKAYELAMTKAISAPKPLTPSQARTQAATAKAHQAELDRLRAELEELKAQAAEKAPKPAKRGGANGQ